LELLGPAIDRALKNLESERTLAVARGKLAEIERRFLVVSENASDVIFLLDPYRRRLTYASTSIARMLKIKDFDPDGFQMTRWFSRADFRTLSRSIAMKIREARLYAAPDKPELHRVDVLSSDGTVVRSEISLSAVEGKDGSFEILGIVRDIGKRLEVEEALRHSLDEKEVLLREVHHRVKNNLQIVSSLLSLQMMANPDPTLGRELSKSQGRIRAMAIIHEQLCESDDVTAISTKYYIEKLASSMVEFADRPVEMRFEVDDFFLDLAEAVPCGLILNELIMNALRHGCPRDGSEVLIRFQGDGPRRTIAVTDRGPGLPAGVDPERSKSLGFTLVNTLTYQLGGSLAWRSGDGCQVSVSWGGKTA
jgi:two-component sensor histidine kinase